MSNQYITTATIILIRFSTCTIIQIQHLLIRISMNNSNSSSSILILLIKY